MSRKKLKTVTCKGTRLEQLKALAQILAEKLDNPEEQNTAQLARQYRETVNDIAEIEEYEDVDDELGRILSERESDGKPGAVRKDRSKFN
jgi:hypothetical protein